MNRRFIVAVIVGICAVIVALSLGRVKEVKMDLGSEYNKKGCVEVGFIEDDRIYIYQKYIK